MNESDTPIIMRDINHVRMLIIQVVSLDTQSDAFEKNRHRAWRQNWS